MTNLLKKILISALTPAFLLTLASCDNLDQSERYVELPPVEVKRVVLLEDFTGQTCRNCPDAHRKIEEIQKQYPDAFVAVSIHGGDMAVNKSGTNFESNRVYLGTDEGQAYNDAAGAKFWPAGVINRCSGVLDRKDWAKRIDEELARPTDVNLKLAAHIEGNEVKIDLTIEPQADIQGKLNVWILENGIVASQLDETGRPDKNYVHNHVFRAPVTPADGESVTLTNGIHTDKNYSIALRYNEQERWNPANLSVVAFVTDKDGVHQAAHADVTPAEDTPEANPTPEN